ncbi:hypothetical protein ACH4F6_32745 [Streptomyces sp. NPDC017936]|uniref:hypothetical protein n=1 Tax=Streptomyces sp. NPDC017936 TaxID=3365016 RepID=UPI0037ACC7BC
MALLTAEYEVVSSTAEAAAWFGGLAEAPAVGAGLPAAVYGVAAAALRSGTGASRVYVPTRSTPSPAARQARSISS